MQLCAKTFAGRNQGSGQKWKVFEAAAFLALQGFSFPERTALLSQVLLFRLVASSHTKKAKGTGGWHSWLPGWGSSPCSVLASF